jgi:PAS domain S-box-containing protein
MQGSLRKKLASMPLVARILITGLVYWLFCWVGTLTFYREYGVAIYWPATGIAILGIFIFGRYASIGIFIASFIINYFVYDKGYASLWFLLISITVISIANTGAALLGSQCLKKRVLKNERSFFRLDSVLVFLLFVVLIPSLVTSITGGTVTYLSGVAPNFFYKAHSWLLADLTGILAIVPLGMAWLETPEIHIRRNQIPEFVIIVFLLILTAYLIFTDFFQNYIFNFLIAYFTIPIYLWLALRFESKIITGIQVLSLIGISYLAIYSNNDYLGTLVDKPYILLQGFSILILNLILVVHAIFMERQQTLISLHKSEQDLNDVLINLPLSVGILDNSFSPVFLNKEFTGKTGLRVIDFADGNITANSTTLSAQTASLLQNAWEGFVEKFKTEPNRESDISLHNRDRDIRSFSLNIRPLKDRYLMVMMDVTQRKQLLEKISEDERRLSSLIQNLRGMVYQCRLDRNWTMEFVSEGSFILTGYLPSDLVYNSKIPFASVIHEQYRDYVWDTIQNAVKKGEPFTLQYQIITKNREVKWVAENGNGIFESDGVCRRVEGFIYDITERVEAHDALQKGEEKYRSLFENMPVSLWEDDYSEVKKQIDLWLPELKTDVSHTLKNKPDLYRKLIAKIKIVDMNRSSLQLYGASDKAKLGESVSEIFSSGDEDAFSSVLASFYHGTSNLEERIMEVKIKKKKRYLSVRWFIMPGYETSLSRILVTILDISDLKKAEKEIRILNQRLEQKVIKRTEDLNRANQELEAFSYSVSHDLKAPLRAVRGFSSLLMEEYAAQLPSGAVHYIENVQKNTDKMTLLITDLLRFSRLGRKSLMFKTIDSYKLVTGIWEDLFNLHKPKETEFVVHALPFIKADEALFTQVFVNLFSNAVKFSKPGVVARIEVSCKSNSEFHEFCVSDNGIGFEQKHADRIFKVFQRLHTSEEFEGNGVGLALVQRIVHRHGGRIAAISEPGHGTSMFFTIPVEADGE